MERDKPIRFFSTFTGVGGFEIGIQRAIPNSECVGMSEFNNHSNKVLKRQFKGVKNYGDITKIKEDELPDFDILCGGFPCQAFSIAGKRMGFEDTRGTLFYDLARIAKCKKPKILFFENVKGLLSHEQGRTITAILQTLDELGYDAEWQLLNSKHFGVPQNRERIIIIGHLRSYSGPKVFPIPKAAKLSAKKGEGKKVVHGTKGTSQWDRVYDAKGVASTLTCTGADNGLYKVKEQLEEGKPRWGDHYKTAEDISPTLMANGKTDVTNVIMHSLQTRSADRPSLKKNPKAGGSGHISKENEAYCLDTGSTQAVEINTRIRRLTPSECEFLQGFPRDWTKYGLDTFLNIEDYNKVYGKTKTNTDKILRTLQETTNKEQGQKRELTELIALLKKEILRPRMYEESVQREIKKGCFETARELQSKAVNICKELRTMWFKEKHRYSSQGWEQVEQLFNELTTSLQKLPHQIASEKGLLEQDIELESEKEHEGPICVLVEISDNQRYKMMGNAVTTNVMEAVARRIHSALLHRKLHMKQ